MATNKQMATSDKVIELKAHIFVKTFENDEGVQHEYVATELCGGELDEDFVDIGIAPKWERDESVWKFYAKKELRSTDEIPLQLSLIVSDYKSKRTGKIVEYPAMYAKSPFTGEQIEFSVKGKGGQAIFNELARKALGLKEGATA